MIDDDEEDEDHDHSLFDVENVEWDIPKPKRRSEFLIRFYDTENKSFNMIKIRGSLLKLLWQIDSELDILEESEKQ